MPALQDPNLGLNYGWDAGESSWNTGVDANFTKVGGLLMLAVEAIAASPTVSTSGTRYVVSTSPTGAFAGQAGKVAVRINSAWVFYSPALGWRAWNKATSAYIRYDGSAWQAETVSAPAQPYLDVSNPGGWTFSNAAWTKVPLYTVTTDTSAAWDANNNTDYIIPSTGMYLLQGIARPIRSSTGALPDNSAMALGIGTTAADSQDVVWGSGPATGVLFTLTVNRTLRLTTGTRISLFAKHGHTAAVGMTFAKLTVLRISD